MINSLDFLSLVSALLLHTNLIPVTCVVVDLVHQCSN